MVQEYLNEIPPTIYGPNKPKTSGKPLRIANLQPPASGQDNPATLYIYLCRSKLTAVHLAMPSILVSIVLSSPTYFLAHTLAGDEASADKIEAVTSNKTTPDTDAENQHPHPDPEDAAAKQIIAVILENVELDPCLGDLKTPLLKFADWRGGQTSVSGSAVCRE